MCSLRRELRLSSISTAPRVRVFVSFFTVSLTQTVLGMLICLSWGRSSARRPAMRKALLTSPAKALRMMKSQRLSNLLAMSKQSSMDLVPMKIQFQNSSSSSSSSTSTSSPFFVSIWVRFLVLASLSFFSTNRAFWEGVSSSFPCGFYTQTFFSPSLDFPLVYLFFCLSACSCSSRLGLGCLYLISLAGVSFLAGGQLVSAFWRGISRWRSSLMNLRSFCFFYSAAGGGSSSSFFSAGRGVGLSSFLPACCSALRMALISEVVLTSMYSMRSSSSSSESTRLGFSAALIIKDQVE